MAFRVELSDVALDDLRDIYRFIEASTGKQSRIWFEKLEAFIERLDKMPERGGNVPEDARFRQLNYGRKPHIFRIIYRVDPAAAVVSIVHVRHGARDAWLPEDESPP